MNIEALCHIPKSNYAYAYKKDELHIRLRTAKNDMERVEIIFGGKYDWINNQKRTMEKILTDEYYDYYQYKIIQQDSRIGYYFGLSSKNKTVYFTETGIVDEFRDELAYCYFFQYPFINEVDVHKEPSWIHDAVFYQIFVERFYNGDTKNSPDNLTNWDDDPNPKSFYGGDLRGIIEKLDYLTDLGINGIYLTPIFQSPSNHKYDTVNYFEVDSYFGDKETFGELVEKAHDRGIKIILDAVFNHCSDNSREFLDVKKNGKKSKYYDWFFIEEYPLTDNPASYKTFSFVPYMPKLNTANKEVKEYLMSAVKYWTSTFQIDGWRLDVSDEIDHRFWREFKDIVKEIDEDIIIIGENWHNSLPWLLGDQFDSVMNYPVTKLCGDFFARNEINAKKFEDNLSTLLVRYSEQVNDAMLNLLDSHDTERFLYSCKGKKEYLKNAAAFLFGYKGIPCTYYGTEIGITGGYDPGCRKGFDWKKDNWDMSLYQYYNRLISIRRQENALKKGTIAFFSTENLFVMERTYKNETILILINNTEEGQKYKINGVGNKQVKELLNQVEWSKEETLLIEISPLSAKYIKITQ